MKKNRKISTKAIVFSAVSISLSTVLANYVKLPSLPFGGSATLFSMLFVALPGYFFGPVVGITAAVSHGILQLISNPYVIHPVQVILDYLLAFGALGFSGFFCRKKNGLLTGYIVGVLGRFVFSSVSGLIFFTEYTKVLSENAAAVWASVLYNISYLFPEMILTIIVLLIPPVRNGVKYIKKIAVE